MKMARKGEDPHAWHDAYSFLPKSWQKEDTGSDYATFDTFKLKLPCRMVISGPSDTRKTSWLMELIRKLEAFSKFYLAVKMTDDKDKLYKYFILQGRKKEQELDVEEGDILKVIKNPDELLGIDAELNPEKHNLLIIDDYINVSDKDVLKQIRDLFTSGRKHGLSIVYITQSFFSLDKVNRNNMTQLVMKGAASRENVSTILRTVNMFNEYPVDMMVELFNLAIENPLNGLMIDLTTSDPTLCLRFNLRGIDVPRFAEYYRKRVGKGGFGRK